MQVSVYRYNPDIDEVPEMRKTTLELPEGKDLMVLDVLELLKAEDPTLSYRRSCREGVCGSDGINMNGKNGLACMTPVSQVVKRGKLVLRPLPGLPVIRDLVVDMSQFYRQYEKVDPFLQNDSPPPPRNGCSLLKSVKSWTVCTSVYCVPAVRRRVRRFGGIRTSSSVRQACCRHTVSWLTVAILPPPNGLPSLTIRSVYFAAGVS